MKNSKDMIGITKGFDAVFVGELIAVDTLNHEIDQNSRYVFYFKVLHMYKYWRSRDKIIELKINEALSNCSFTISQRKKYFIYAKLSRHNKYSAETDEKFLKVETCNEIKQFTLRQQLEIESYHTPYKYINGKWKKNIFSTLFI